jgi:hypothetical protein
MTQAATGRERIARESAPKAWRRNVKLNRATGLSNSAAPLAPAFPKQERLQRVGNESRPNRAALVRAGLPR